MSKMRTWMKLQMLHCMARLWSPIVISQSTLRKKWLEAGAVETEVITPGKIVPSKCCLPSWNISVKKNFNTDVLFN